MLPIFIEEQAPTEQLDRLQALSWPVREYAVGEFFCRYQEREVCYLLEGTAVVTTEAGMPLELASGDLVVFPAETSCTWQVLQPLRMHYRLG